MRRAGCRLSFIALVVAGLITPFTIVMSDEGTVPEVLWSDSVKDSFADAGKDGKPLLIDVWAVWCAPCKLMDRTTYRDPHVIEGAKKFVALKIDADIQKNFIERYQVDAFPTVLFLDGEGREIARRMGFVDAKTILAAFSAVLDGYPGYLAAAGSKTPEAREAVGRYLLAAGNGTDALPHLKAALKAAGSDAERRASLDLAIAQAQFLAGDAKGAAAAFAKLAAQAGDQQGPALLGLVRAERERGREAQAAAAEKKLREQFPALAAGL